MSRPQCIGFIMDGNRRWALAQGLPPLEGHRQGVRVFDEVIRCVVDLQIPHAVFYAFSSENWKREESEVQYLLGLFEENITQVEEELAKGENEERKKITFKFVGDRGAFSPSLQARIASLEEQTTEHVGVTVWVAFSYGGRAEIVTATNTAIEQGKPVTEGEFAQLLWTIGMPDPDIIIRTGGQKRLSNFLPWQAVYSELFFIDTLWPAFTPDELRDIISEFTVRQRNFGR